MKILPIIILISLVGVASASFNPSDVEWGTGVSGTLYKGGILTNGEYTIKVIEFPSPVPGVGTIENYQKKIVPEAPVSPGVHFGLYKNNTFVGDVILTASNNIYIDPDYEVMITATGYPSNMAQEWVMEYYKPWATLSIQKRGLPKLDVTFTTDKNTYFDGETFTASITVKNSGEAVAKNVDMVLGIGPLSLLSDTSKLHQTYYKMEKGESKSFDVSLSVPEMLGESNFNISLIQKFGDIKGLEYSSMSYTPISVSPRLINFGKSLKDRMYLKDTSIVRLTVSNIGKFGISNIHLNDSLGESFKLKSGKLQWDIPSLKPGQEWSAEYSVMPTDANINGFIVPAANLNFFVGNRGYNISSQTNTVIVNGPKMIINKSVNKSVVGVGNFVKVNVAIKNVGNIGTRISVEDTLPTNISLNGGVTSLENFLDPGSVQEFNYTIRMNNEGKIELPVATGNYTDIAYRGIIKGFMSSGMVIINVTNASELNDEDVNNASKINGEAIGNNTNSAESESIPGFEGISVIIIMAFLMFIRNKI